MSPEHSTNPWQERYVHGTPGTFRIYSGPNSLISYDGTSRWP